MTLCGEGDEGHPQVRAGEEARAREKLYMTQAHNEARCSQEEGARQLLFSPPQRFCFWVHFLNLEVSLTLMKDCRYPSEGSLWRHAAFLDECTRMAP